MSFIDAVFFWASGVYVGCELARIVDNVRKIRRLREETKRVERQVDELTDRFAFRERDARRERVN